jgi:membrane-bound lytic murein transglycosylase B
MRKIIEVALVALFVTSTMGASTYAQSQNETLTTKININPNNPNAISVVSKPTDNISLNFDKNSAIPVNINDKQIVKIVPGDSNQTINDNNAKAAASQAAQKSQIATPKTSKQVISVAFNGDFTSLYQAAGARFGVPWQILAAVHSVESGQSGDTTRSSGAGATGPMQFLPSTFRAYAVDGDGDGVANIYGVVDSVYSAANYISTNMHDTGSVEGAIFCYNHSNSYVQKVLAIARGFGY